MNVGLPQLEETSLMNKVGREIGEKSQGQEESPPTFMGVALHIYGGKGHVFSYHKALGEAIRLNGWMHLAIISPDPNLPELPREWSVEYIDSGILDYEGGCDNKAIETAEHLGVYQEHVCFGPRLYQGVAEGTRI